MGDSPTTMRAFCFLALLSASAKAWTTPVTSYDVVTDTMTYDGSPRDAVNLTTDDKIEIATNVIDTVAVALNVSLTECQEAAAILTDYLPTCASFIEDGGDILTCP